ncbi:MAG: hypothetical protein IPH12_18635 [Saprospirales bacterium]|nr:hypothetical protein [Saprospirales bacterium]
MELVIGIIIGLVVGGIAAYYFASQTIKKSNQKAIEEGNRQADLAIQEARLTAKRITDEAAVQAEKL